MALKTIEEFWRGNKIITTSSSFSVPKEKNNINSNGFIITAIYGGSSCG